MYCNNCGQRLSEDAKHCPNCGVKIEYRPEQKAEQPDSSGAAGPVSKTEPEMPHFDGSDYTDYSENPGGRTEDYTAVFKPENGGAAPNKGDGYAVAGLILSLCGMVTCCIPLLGLMLSLLGLIFSVRGLKSKLRHTMAVIALCVSAVFLLLSLIMGIAFVFSVVNAQAWNEVLESYGWSIEDFVNSQSKSHSR